MVGAPQKRTRFTIIGGLVLVALVVGILAWRATDDGPPKGPDTNEMFDEDGNLAVALPGPASDIEVEANDDGSSQVTFSITYDVAHPGEADPPATVSSDGKVTVPKAATPKPDMGAVTVQVSEAMGAGGPIRLSPMSKETQFDRKLTKPTTTNDYSFRLNPKTTEFLNGKGLTSKTSSTRAKALQYIDIDVEHLRDWKVEDGEYDWQQGQAYTAADEPVKGAEVLTAASTMTVTNSTGDGVYGPTFEGLSTADGTYSYDTWNNQLNDTSVYGTPISLSGQAVECIEQGSGSNPQGFAMLNGWDIRGDLPPGILPVGASVTQPITADDGLGRTTLDMAQETATATVQVLAAALGSTTPGLKSAISNTVLLAMGLTEFAAPITAALGVPLNAILGLAQGVYDAMTNSCASFANVVNLTAAEPQGAMTSVSWGDQTNGLDLTYSSASYDGAPVDDNVATVASNGLVTTEMAGGSAPYSLNPYLEQAATVSCGSGTGNGSGGGCSGGSGNNQIDIRWTTQPMCPYGDATLCVATEDENEALPQITVPGTDLCGTDNQLCTTIPAPNPDAQEASDTDLAGAGFETIFQSYPDHAISSIATDDEGDVYYGDDNGTIWELNDFGTAVDVLTIGSSDTITGMVLNGDDLLFTAGDELYVWQPSDPSSLSTYSLPSSADSADIHHLQWDGNTSFYLATDSDLYAWTQGASSIVEVDTSGWKVPSGEDIESLAQGSGLLFVGFQDGYIERCPTSDCASSWVQTQPSSLGTAVQAMQPIGDTLFAGFGNGAVLQMDAYGGGETYAQGAMDQGGQVAGMADVDGNVYIGGCLSNQDPVSGDWLGLEILTSMAPSGQKTWNPNVLYESCQNPSATTSQMKGFSDENYAIASTPATAEHGALVFIGQDISSSNYLYVLENTNKPTTANCVESWGNCPTPPAVPVPASTTVAPAGSLAALGQPVMNSTCGVTATKVSWTAASSSEPISTNVGESVTDGFQLTPPTSSSGCTTTYTWNLNGTGTLPYDTWQANAYPAVEGEGTVDLDVATDWGSGLPLTVDGQAAATGAQANGLFAWGSGSPPTNGASPTTAELASTGAQLAVDVSGGAPMLVLELTTPAGASAGSTSVVFANDVLTSDGQTAPDPVPLWINPSTTTTTTTGSSSTSPSTTSTTAATTTTTPATTTTTLPPNCGFPTLKASSPADAVWPLDDRTTTAVDVSGNGNDAQIANAQANDQAPGPLADCLQNGALQFDGSSTSVAAPGAVEISTDELTVMAFVKVDGVVFTGTLIADDAPMQSKNGVAFGIETKGQGSITNVSLELGLETGPWNVAYENEDGPVDGQWHLLVGTYDSSTGTAVIYIDGQQVVSDTASGEDTINPGAGPVTIGVDPAGNVDWFNGQMADVAVLSQALSAEQVASIWATAQGS